MSKKVKTKKYKLKTYKSAAKRFKATGSGMLMRTRGPKSHLRRRKSARAKAGLARTIAVVGVGSRRRLMRLLPYVKKYRANPPRG